MRYDISKVQKLDKWVMICEGGLIGSQTWLRDLLSE
jgi:hypothetical protein